MCEIKFRIYFEADEDEPAWMSESITLLDLLHGEDIEFTDKEDTVSLPLNDFRFFYKPNEKYKLMQYTGLKDKNGKEIYEGDIVKVTHKGIEDIGKIIYEYNGFIIDVMNMNRNYGRVSLIGRYTEVIGNIYENPELLKEN